MSTSVLNIFFSFLIVALALPAAQLVEASTPTTAKKTIHKKTASAKGKRVSGKTRVAAIPRQRQLVSFDSREKLVKKYVLVRGKRKAVYQRVTLAATIPVVPPVLTAGDLAGLNLTKDTLDLQSSVALVMDQSNSQVLFEKNSKVALPIASITKLMTSLVVVEAHQDMDEMLEITNDDIDREKNTRSRLRVGAKMTRANMLHIALMSSENRAASALGRHYPGGLPAFVAAMNAKARTLGMTETRYVDASGLSSQNVASARDLAKLVVAAHEHPLIRQYSTDIKYMVDTGTGSHPLQYATTNYLVASPDWDIGLQKTGYISEAGRCLVMQVKIEGRAIVMIFLDSKGKQSRLADAGRIRKWLEHLAPQSLTQGRPALPHS